MTPATKRPMPFPDFLTTATIAKHAMLDRRTAMRRLNCAGLEPDAVLCEPHGLVALWRRERLAELLDAIARQGPVAVMAETPLAQ